MKILYAIQGTGNGHIARAEDVIPVLREYGELDLFVSGAQADIKLDFDVKYKSKGLSFYFGKRGGVDLVRTFKKNSSKEVYKEINKFPVEDYDVVINDFEPITAWACRRKGIPCVALSHQAALLSSKVPKPKHFDLMGDWILRNYAPCDAHVGFHFSTFDKDIFTPVIRRKVREARISDEGHYAVYLPAYDDKKLIPLLLSVPRIRWRVFSKHARRPYHIDRISVYPVNNDDFTASIASATGVLCGAGFETPAEALYMGKKLMVVPMKKQYEQHYNAAALKALGVPVLKKMKRKQVKHIEAWIETPARVTIAYENITAQADERAFGHSSDLTVR